MRHSQGLILKWIQTVISSLFEWAKSVRVPELYTLQLTHHLSPTVRYMELGDGWPPPPQQLYFYIFVVSVPWWLCKATEAWEWWAHPNQCFIQCYRKTWMKFWAKPIFQICLLWGLGKSTNSGSSSVKWGWCGFFCGIMHMQLLAQSLIHRKYSVSINQCQKTFLEWKNELNEPWSWVRAEDTWCTCDEVASGEGVLKVWLCVCTPSFQSSWFVKTGVFVPWQNQGKQSEWS